MNSSLLRIDWYSFLVGTQVSSVIGLMTTSSYLGIRIRFAREYLYPSVSNDNTLFLYRIKEPGNWFRNGMKLLCTVFEKNIVAGMAYVFIEKSIRFTSTKQGQESIAKAFICGGLVGLYSFFSFNYFELGDLNIYQVFLCSLASAEVSALFDEIKTLKTVDQELNFDLSIPFRPLTFWNGGIVGCLAAIFHSNFMNNLDVVAIPDIDDTDSNWIAFKKYLEFLQEILQCVFKFIMSVNERFLASGVLQCAFEYIARNVIGWKLDPLHKILACSLHGIYLGLESGHFKSSLKLSWIVTSIFQIGVWIHKQTKTV